MDIRWQQRFNNLKKAFAQLSRFIEQKELNELEEQGLIKAFEYTFELSWKTLQDLLKYKGYNHIAGPKPVIKQSFQDGYISDGTAWMRMHESRNLASHTYDHKTAVEVITGIREEYYFLFESLVDHLTQEIKSNNA